jgi:hypothetical protein
MKLRVVPLLVMLALGDLLAEDVQRIADGATAAPW